MQRFSDLAKVDLLYFTHALRKRGLFENVETTMIREKLTAKPWAYATRKGFKPGEPTGNYFRYFGSKEDAERSAKITARNKRWHGPIEYRPGECNAVTLEGAAWIANDNKPDLPWWLEGAE